MRKLLKAAIAVATVSFLSVAGLALGQPAGSAIPAELAGSWRFGDSGLLTLQSDGRYSKIAEFNLGSSGTRRVVEVGVATVRGPVLSFFPADCYVTGPDGRYACNRPPGPSSAEYRLAIGTFGEYLLIWGAERYRRVNA